MASPPDTPNSASPLWSAQRIAVEVDGPDGHREVLVDKPFARVGRDQRSEVPISDGRLFPCHAYLHATDEGVYYVGLGSDVASGWLLPSEDVQVGPFRLRARLIDGKPDRPLPMDLQAKRTGVSQVPHLRAVSSSRAARFTDLRLRRQLTLLGRELPSTRRLNHPTISRVHCAVFWDGQQLWLVDFFSSNGTRLAGKKFDFGRLLAGQEFKLGSVRFSYLGTKHIDASVPDGSALDQPVGILEQDDDAEGNDAELRLAETEARSSALATLHAGRDEHFSSIEQGLEALRQQCERFERERDEFQRQLLQERDANQERLVAIREELAKEVTALQIGSESAAREFQRLSNEVATTREVSFARYAEVGPKSAEEAARADDERLQIASALQNAETRWMKLAQDLSRRTLELQRQIAESQEAHHSLAGSIRLEREQMQGRLRAERRAYRRRLAHAKRDFAAELARIHEESTAVRHDLQALEAEMVRVQPTPAPGEAEAAGAPGEPHRETVKRHAESFLLAESQRKELSEAIERRATGLAQQIADCRQADLALAESFKAALRETARQLASQQQAQSRHVGAVKDELLAGHATLRDEIAALRQELAAVQPTLARLESGEWLAELERRWQTRLQATTNEVSQQIADLRRQSSLDEQAASDRVAVLEGAPTAKIADVRSGLDLLLEAREQQHGALGASSVASHTARGETDSQRPVGPSPLPGRRETEFFLGGEAADTDALQPSETYQDAEGAGSPDWVISDEVTRRLIDFKTNRDPTARRRLLWSAIAAALVAIIVSGAGIIRIWLNGSEETKGSEAASLSQSRLVDP